MSNSILGLLTVLSTPTYSISPSKVLVSGHENLGWQSWFSLVSKFCPALWISGNQSPWTMSDSTLIDMWLTAQFPPPDTWQHAEAHTTCCGGMRDANTIANNSVILKMKAAVLRQCKNNDRKTSVHLFFSIPFVNFLPPVLYGPLPQWVKFFFN